MPQSRENNFGAVKLIGALLVMLGHMPVLLGLDPITVAGEKIDVLGADILFLVSGYLVTHSWLRDPHPARYALRRFFRFWPPLCLAVLLMTFAAGPLLSDLGAAGYFGSWYRAYLDNLLLRPVYGLPGVFTDNPGSSAVIGSLWTMPVEVLACLLLPPLLLALRRRREDGKSWRAALATVLLVCAADLCLRFARCEGRALWYGTDWVHALHMLVFFLLGMLFTWPQAGRLLKPGAALLGVLCLPFLSWADPTTVKPVIWLVLPCAVFSLALACPPRLSRVGRRWDLTFGIYLYGFFFQQLTVWLREQGELSWRTLTCLLISLLPTLLTAFLSCMLVENPCRILCGRLLDLLWKGRAAGPGKTPAEKH